MKKTITHDEYLTAKGLFHLAQEACRRSQEYEAGLGRILGSGDSYLGHISDALFDAGGFEQALEKEGISVAAKREG